LPKHFTRPAGAVFYKNDLFDLLTAMQIFSGSNKPADRKGTAERQVKKLPSRRLCKTVMEGSHVYGSIFVLLQPDHSFSIVPTFFATAFSRISFAVITSWLAIPMKRQVLRPFLTGSALPATTSPMSAYISSASGYPFWK